MMKLFMAWLAKQRNPNGSTFARRPYVVVRREQPVAWSKGDSAALAHFMRGEVWKKVELLQEDAAIVNLLPGPEKSGVDAEFMATFVAGRCEFLRKLYELAAIRRNVPEEPKATGDEEASADEKMPIQISG